jgi:DNA polymerase III alpha subunit (gram-positive type)
MIKYLIFITVTFLIIIFGSIWAFDIGIEGVVINPELKPSIQKITTKVKDLIYDEATKHNPDGDMIPDMIDDKIKEEIKERVN